MRIRPYEAQDFCPCRALFYASVHTLAAADYTAAQRAAWAPMHHDGKRLEQALAAHHTLVAEEAGVVAGFADVDDRGYLDHLYVHPDFARRGVATTLVQALEDWSRENGVGRMTTHASRTAQPFFVQRGYHVLLEQQVERQGEWLTNFLMEKLL